jgi:hypothetical protein
VGRPRVQLARVLAGRLRLRRSAPSRSTSSCTTRCACPGTSTRPW